VKTELPHRCPVAAVVALQLGLLGACLCAAQGCSVLDRRETPGSGKSLSYTPGVPDFDMEAVETVQDTASCVDVYIRIPQSSLIFLKREASYAATFEVRVRFIADQDESSPVDEIWGDSVQTDSPGERRRVEETLIRRRYTLVPGAYRAEVSLQDMNTGVMANRRQLVRVFDLGSGCAVFTRIRLETLTVNGMSPCLPLHIRENLDSLRALLTVYRPSGIRDGAVQAILLRYPTDSTLSSPPNYLTPLTWSLRSRGVELNKPCTLWTARRRVSGNEPWNLEFDLGHLERGMHELVVDAAQEPCNSQEDGLLLQTRRFLCIVDHDFPRMTTLGQLIEALPYLARRSEYQEFISAKTDEERIRLFEKFWLNLGGNAENTRILIRHYYTRIEEANLLFSNYKEGWKTDRGMIYVVFGPPPLIERQLSTEAWSYSNGYRFVFERVRRLRGDEPFENIVLLRDPVYERAWTKEIERWRRGVVF